MRYQISYDDSLVAGPAGVERTEYFQTEFEALTRARQLLEGGDHHGVAIRDDTGSVLTGIRLQLKLGLQGGLA